MNKHYPFHTSVLDNFYGCDPYNTVDAQRMRRHVRTVAGFERRDLYAGAVHQNVMYQEVK